MDCSTLGSENSILFHKLYFKTRETRVKREVQADNGALAYQEVATYYYSPTEEDSLLDVQVTTLNPIYVVCYPTRSMSTSY